jgi:hypothetical protein
MIPGTIAMGGSVPNPQMIQYGRYTYNAGFVNSGTMTINIATQMPFVRAGELMRIDGLWWAGSFCEGWKDRVAFYFKYGTAYNSGNINGGGSKNHIIYFQYAGGATATVGHFYTGDSSDFKQAEVSIDRLYWFDTTVGASNYFVKNLPA